MEHGPPNGPVDLPMTKSKLVSPISTTRPPRSLGHKPIVKEVVVGRAILQEAIAQIGAQISEDKSSLAASAIIHWKNVMAKP